MSQLDNPLEIYKLLPKTNCRECSMPTCMAFASAVIKGQKSLDECPYVESDIVEESSIKIHNPDNLDQQQEKIIAQLREEITGIDFPSTAERLGARYVDDRLIIKCLGLNFIIDSKGNISSNCHVNAWVTIPLYDYIINSKGIDCNGTWVTFKELANGMTRSSFFNHRCVETLKKIADNQTDLFEKLMHIFNGKPVTGSFSFDMSFILYPLPKVPILICYNRQENHYESKLSIFFDKSAEYNLNIDSLYFVCAGIVTMIERIIFMHGD
ncbi:MAG: DUF3786 domain-containing protein [Clostridiales bacterium]|nr:DUF3786 domain-containing protein [Clostridiales bacterium]MCF8021590.1 DUF3786 domain-containing protein [Clostridiales bacterium]